MRYRFHNDIVYTRVCGVSMLVALRGSWDRFPAVRQLSSLQGCFCQGIEDHMEEDELIQAIRLPEKINREKVRDLYHAFTAKLFNEGCLVPDDSLEQDGTGETGNE